MRKIVTIIIMTLIYMQPVLSQIEPPEVELINITPDWMYISRDTTVPPVADNSLAQYTNRFLIWSELHEQSLYIIETVRSHKGVINNVGWLLHKLDAETGELQWINHNSYHTGNMFREFPHSMTFREDGNIQVLGYRSIDTIEFEIFNFWFNTNPLKRIIDDEDGSMLEVTCPSDTSRLGMLVSGVGNRVETLGSGDIVNMARRRYWDEEVEYIALEIYDIDDQTMRQDTPYIHSIVHNTGNEYDYGIFLFWKLNKDTMVMHFSKRNLEDKKKSPKELKLVMADISEKSKLGVIKEKVITDVVYYPQHQFNDDIIMLVKDDNIIVSQRVLKDAITSPDVWINWIAWYDKNFELKANLHELKNNQGQYYRWIEPIGVKDGVLYYFGQVGINFEHDVLRIVPGATTAEIIGQIQIRKTSDIQRSVLAYSRFLPNNKVLVFIGISVIVESGLTRAVPIYYGIDFDQLGITSVKSEESAENELHIHPNPATHSITIIHGHEGKMRIEVLDIMGRVLICKTAMSAGEDELDVSVLNAGVYVVRVLDRRGVVVGRGKVVRR